MTDNVTKVRCTEIDNGMLVLWSYQYEPRNTFKRDFLVHCCFTWTIYIFIVLFRKPPSYLCDVFAVLVLMPQFIKRPNFLFSVEYYPLLAADIENLKICILAGNHILGKNEKSLLQKNIECTKLFKCGGYLNHLFKWVVASENH